MANHGADHDDPSDQLGLVTAWLRDGEIVDCGIVGYDPVLGTVEIGLRGVRVTARVQRPDRPLQVGQSARFRVQWTVGRLELRLLRDGSAPTPPAGGVDLWT